MPTPDVKNWGVPFAPSTGRVWPVVNEPKTVPYTRSDGTVVGNAATAFHATRESATRHHAGIDLLCAPNDRVVAIDRGTVRGMIPGFVRLGAVVVDHPAFVAVYAEIALDALARAGLKTGDTVRAGQTIGFGVLNYEGHSMLHFETWDRAHPPAAYTPWHVSAPAAPAGLLDPTRMLLDLAAGKVSTSSSSSGGGGIALAAAAVVVGGLVLFGGRK